MFYIERPNRTSIATPDDRDRFIPVRKVDILSALVDQGAIAKAHERGKFVEICGKLPSGARVGWSFEAQEALDFNIHYHVGDKVEFTLVQAGKDYVITGMSK